MRFKTKFFKISINKYRILIWGRLSKYKYYEIQIEPGGMTSGGITISACIFKRLFSNLVFGCNIDLGKLLWCNFMINDPREWDEHTDKPATWEEYEKLPQKREGKPKYKSRRQGKEKWYFSSKFLKLFNLDVLNDPYGITIDLAWFQFPIYTSVQLGNHPRHKFCLSLDIGKTPAGFVCEFEFCMFGYFADFKVGQNTVARNVNLKYIDDFYRLVSKSEDVYIEMLLAEQIQRKNLPYIQAIVKSCDILQNTKKSDEFIILASYDDTFREDIFNFLIENIIYFNGWDEIEKNINMYEPLAVEKLNNLLSNTLTQIVGEDENFKYYTMENEYNLAEPHIHICVDFDDKNWQGEKFRNGQPLKTIATIKIFEKHGIYTTDNLVLDEVIDSKINNYKGQICKWLNAPDKSLNEITNVQLALRNYLLSNPDCVVGWRYKNNKNPTNI